MTKSLKNIYLENADHDLCEVDFCALKCVLLAIWVFINRFLVTKLFSYLIWVIQTQFITKADTKVTYVHIKSTQTLFNTTFNR